jgi:serine/threonine-protein kinase
MNGAAVFVLTLLTSAFTALATVVVVDRTTLLRAPAPPEPVMPEMRGLFENEARIAAGAAHAELFVSSHEPSSEVHSGTVIRQSVPPGHHVPPGTSVSVVLAEGIARVPSVLNVPLAEAVKRLDERGYSVQVGPAIADEKVPVDVIVRQLPKADAAYAQPGIVVIEPSAGPADVELPKFTGMGITIAKTRIEELGLKAIVHWVGMAETATNVVLSQSPASGQKVKPGSEVQLTVCMP